MLRVFGRAASSRQAVLSVPVREFATQRKRTKAPRREAPRKAPTPPPEPPGSGPTEKLKADAEWLMSEERTEHLNKQEKWVMRIGVGMSALAIASFSYTKWEVENRLKEELNDEERTAWYAGTYNHENAQQKRQDTLQKAQDEEERRLWWGPPLAPISLEGFEAADTFVGPREGMVFKKDIAGLGYYMDQRLDQRALLGEAKGA